MESLSEGLDARRSTRYSTGMTAGRTWKPAFEAACALVLVVVASSTTAASDVTRRLGIQSRPLSQVSERVRGRQPPASPASSPVRSPRAFLIYLIDGGDPIIVKRYSEENDQIRFEKYGGWVGIPKYEILKIVPDEPDATANLPPAPAASPDIMGPPPSAAASEVLHVTMRGGATVKATGVTPEGARVRVTVPDGSFTLPRSDLIGVVRVPSGPGTPEAWLSILSTEAADGAENGRPPRPIPTSLSQPPFLSSHRPHLLRLANGQILRIEGFWIEDGEFRFRRLGGLVGMALGEIVRLIPEDGPPVLGRTPVRFRQQLGPDLLEVRVRSGTQRVRLIGVEPVARTRTFENPWRHLERGLLVYLEFDRQRYDPQGDWLAYVFLANGRMLNAELIRLGLARPRPDGRNVRYLDLFHEIATADPVDLGSPSLRSN